jgi:hypothetical protein
MTVAFTITSRTFDTPWIITDGNDVYIGSQSDSIVVRNVLCGMDSLIPATWDRDRQYQRGNNCPFLCNQLYTVRKSTTAINLTGYWVTKPYHSEVYRRSSSGQFAANTDMYKLWSASTVLEAQMYTDFPTKQEEIDRQWPCPTGYHIPTCAEWSKLLILFAEARGLSSYISYFGNGLAYLNNIPSTEMTIFRNALGIPAQCYQSRVNTWAIPSKGTNIWIWTASHNGPTMAIPQYVGVTDTTSFLWAMYSAIPAYVMCFKNRFS